MAQQDNPQHTTVTAALALHPRPYDEIGHVLDDLKNGIVKSTAKCRIRLDAFDFRGDTTQSDDLIHSVHITGSDYNATGQSRDLDSLENRMALAIDQAVQSLVNREKTIENQEAIINLFTEHDTAASINGKSYIPKEPQIRCPPSADDKIASGVICLFDIARGRVKTGYGWATLAPRIGEIFRNEFCNPITTYESSQNSKKFLDLAETVAFLHTLQNAINKSEKILDDPLQSLRDEPRDRDS